MAQFSHNEDCCQIEDGHDPVTPGDELQSSPGELMDSSPLPITARRTLARSTSMFESQLSQSQASASFTRPAMHRPPLLSRSAFSSFAIPSISERKPSLFGNQISVHMDKENDLADQFEDSPKKSSGPFSNLSFGKKLHEVTSPFRESDVERTPLTPVSFNSVHKRRLPQFRRTQSMITKDDEFLAPEFVQPTPNTHKQQVPLSPEHTSADCKVLPSFESNADQMRRITGSTLAQVLDGKYKQYYDKLEVIDCRFPHEFEGGHIPQAINISSLDALDKHPLLIKPLQVRTLIILHCEYSAHRAPRIALHLRNWDRTANAHRYPKLFYPEVYILDGGYSNFYKEYRHHVGSGGYVEMNDPVHKPFASKQMHNFRKNTKFQRTQSYTFGQDSPLAGGARMEREHTFRLHQCDFLQGKVDSIPQVLELASRPPTFGTLPEPIHQETQESDNDTTDDGGDCSMMDVDECIQYSPLPMHTDAANVLYRKHTRTSSSRIDPRRMSSF